MSWTDAGRRRGGRLRAGRALMLAVLAGALVFSPAALARKPLVYRVSMAFTQVRPWTYHYEQASDGCVRTDDSNGLTVVKLHGTGLFTLRNRAQVGIGVVGTYRQTGMSTHTVSGSVCAASNTFPSTWSVTTQTGGTMTATEPTGGCGTKRPKVSFPELTLVGWRLVLEWAGDGGLDYDAFDPCPYFDGSNQASSGSRLPGAAYRDIVAKLNRAKLHSGARRISARGKSARSATETCGNIVQGCAEGVTYNATARVTSTVNLVLTRTRR